MDTQPLDELYFVWLYSQVADPDIVDPHLTRWGLLRLLFQKEFTWIVKNDDNRAEDGKDLRRQFVHGESLEDVDPEWTELGCSMLEVMVGLARRLEFETEGELHYWFWQLMENLGIEGYSDAGHIPADEINEVLDQVLHRTYERDGSGGFFPLKNPHRDQTKVELWYQLSAYVLELSE